VGFAGKEKGFHKAGEKEGSLGGREATVRKKQAKKPGSLGGYELAGSLPKQL